MSGQCNAELQAKSVSWMKPMSGTGKQQHRAEATIRPIENQVSKRKPMQATGQDTKNNLKTSQLILS